MAFVLYGVVQGLLFTNVVAQESCGHVAARVIACLTFGLVDPLKAEREAVEAEAAALPVEVHLRRAGGPAEQSQRYGGLDPAGVAFFPRSTTQSELLSWVRAAYSGGLGEKYLLETQHMMDQKFAIVTPDSRAPMAKLVTPYSDLLFVKPLRRGT